MSSLAPALERAAALVAASALTATTLADGFVRFTGPTQSIKVEGNTVFPTVDMTYEARVRVAAGTQPGRLITEQRNSFEDKHVMLGPQSFLGYWTRGLNCGTVNSSDLSEDLSGAWHHIALVRAGATTTLYVDGIEAGSWQETNQCVGNSWDSEMCIGCFRGSIGQTVPAMLGDIDWIRVSTNARYTGEFAPPLECDLAPDASTALLLRFNEAPGTMQLIDESAARAICRFGVGTYGNEVTSPSLEIGAPSCCVGDIVADRRIDGADLGTMLAYWGPRTSAPFSIASDLDVSGQVDGADLGMLLVNWGPCQSSNVPAWATVLETQPDPAVVTDPTLRAAITATGLPWRVRDTGTGIEMLLVPPGTFQMGCSASDHWGCWAGEYPVHPVTMSTAFYMGRYEVTQAQWQARMGSNPAFFSKSNGQAGSDDRPVEMVSWNDAQGFLVSSGMRLPTEAEWEYAYRAGTTTAYHGWAANPGGTNNDGEVGAIGWYIYNTCYADGCGTRTVGLKAANGFGLQDMLGNVSEFVGDWYGDYEAGPQSNPTGPVSGTQRVIRGGSWFNSTPSFNVRSSFRIGFDPDRRTEFDGFRVARNP